MKKKQKMQKNLVGIFQVGIFQGLIHQGGVWLVEIYRVGVFSIPQETSRQTSF